MTSGIVALFLLAPLMIVPLGYGLLEVARPGSRPPRLAFRVLPVASGLLIVAFLPPAGLAAGVLALPWLMVTGLIALAAVLRLLRDPDRFRPGIRHATDAAVVFLAVGSTFALIDRLDVRPFDFPATVILLTAVHFHFAGFVLPLVGALAYERRHGRLLELAIGAVVIGIPVTALGFFGIPIANWIGAMLTAVGGFGIGIATLRVARTMARRSSVVLAAVAGASLSVSMPMAVIYTTGVLVGTTWLDLSTMAAIHGTLNALGFAVPATVAWMLDRRARVAADSPNGARPVRDLRRPGLGAAAIIAAYALVVGAISAGVGGLAGGGDFAAQETVPRPLLLVGLCMVPGVLAVIGTVRRSGSVLIAGGLLCLAQAFISFVALPFAVVGFVLLALGAEALGVKASWRGALGGIFVVVLGIAAWVAPFALTETSCWVARTGADGAVVYERTPVPQDAGGASGGGEEQIQLNPGDLASGCDSGEMTLEGAGLAAVFGIGALALAALASMTPRPPHIASEEYA
jgi:hypothetical protein